MPVSYVSQYDLGSLCGDWRMKPNFTLSWAAHTSTPNNIGDHRDIARALASPGCVGGGKSRQARNVYPKRIRIFYYRFQPKT